MVSAPIAGVGKLQVSRDGAPLAFGIGGDARLFHRRVENFRGNGLISVPELIRFYPDGRLGGGMYVGYRNASRGAAARDRSTVLNRMSTLIRMSTLNRRTARKTGARMVRSSLDGRGQITVAYVSKYLKIQPAHGSSGWIFHGDRLPVMGSWGGVGLPFSHRNATEIEVQNWRFYDSR